MSSRTANFGNNRATGGLASSTSTSTTSNSQRGDDRGARGTGTATGTGVRNTSASDRRAALQMFDDMMYIYHQNFRNYNQNIQLMIDGVLTNRTFARNGIDEIVSINTVYNENMRGYTDTVNSSLNIYRDIYFGNQPRSNANSNSMNALLRMLPISNNRPRAFVNYAIFPNIPPIVDSNDQPLTIDQIQQFTDEYLYVDASRSDVSGVGGIFERHHICSITLDMFQEGDRILRIRQCGHEFKSEPLLEWFRRSSKCPLCRCNLLDRRQRIPIPVHDVSDSITNVSESTAETERETDPDQDQEQDQEQEDEEQVVDRSSNSEVETAAQVRAIPSITPTIQRVIETSIQNGIQEIFSNNTNFGELFENMLMSNTSAPPTITNDIEPLLQSFLREVITPIESIDITYTVEHMDNNQTPSNNE
jgi:predicted Zn-ribbon and HTH transcriptional regulator